MAQVYVIDDRYIGSASLNDCLAIALGQYASGFWIWKKKKIVWCLVQPKLVHDLATGADYKWRIVKWSSNKDELRELKKQMEE